MGWGAYFRHGNSTQQLQALDGYVFRRLARFITRKYGKRGYRRGMADLLESKTQLGLYRLTGTIDYASAHASRRTMSVSRVRENLTHGSTGGGRRPAPVG